MLVLKDLTSKEWSSIKHINNVLLFIDKIAHGIDRLAVEVDLVVMLRVLSDITVEEATDPEHGELRELEDLWWFVVH